MTGVLAGMIGGMKGPTKPVTAPTSLSAIPTNTNVAISFTAPSDNGSSPITNYEYSFNNSTWTALSPADAVSPITVSGLTQNTAYTIYLRAVNIFGSGPASSVLSFTTQGVPTGAVTITSVPYTTTTATVNFTAAAGGGAITGYDLYVVNQTNAWNNTTASPISVTGLTPNTAYAFYVRSKNAYGLGPQSAPFSITTLQTFPSSVEYLVIGGGGGSGTNGGGGGGAGGYLTSTLSVTGSTNYTVTVGAAGGGGSPSGSGGNSVFASVTSTGGGGGGSRDSDFAGKNGGSGGGGGGTGGPACPGGTGIAGQGNSGAAGRTGGGEAAGGGGGGATSAGGASPAIYYGGNGGGGAGSSITGTFTGYAGGGVGMGLGYLGGQPGVVAAGYGGGGPQNGSANGRVNSGGGGGDVAGGSGGGSGGSGVVIIAYPNSFRELQSISGSLSATLSNVSRSGYRVYTFTSGTGTITF